MFSEFENWKEFLISSIMFGSALTFTTQHRSLLWSTKKSATIRNKKIYCEMWKYSRHEMQLQHKTTMLYDTPGSEKESLKSMNKLCFSFPESHSEYYCTYFMCCAFLCCSHNNFKSLIKKTSSLN